MTNDAKLGLVLGVAIVLVIALVFFRHEPAMARTPTEPDRPTTAWQKTASADDVVPATNIAPREAKTPAS